ncbi:hypothetical protein LG277_00235 [Vreelandella aquamarina]|uniref:hypothetical protein n=1 Tax=Vreelandella aquamarina TaxID=77097 RepID=UPI00384BE3FA
MGTRTFCKTLSFTLLAIGCLPALALATPYNISEAQRHQHWQSMALSLGDERHFRAVETHSYSDATFSVNATQGICDLPWLELRVTLENLQGEDTTVNMVPTLVRVDDRPIHQGVAEFITQRGDDGFYVHFYLNDLNNLLEEMPAGDQLFVAFEQDERDPWHMTFSLQGAGAALTRLQAGCSNDGRKDERDEFHPPTSLYSESVSMGDGRENQ